MFFHSPDVNGQLRTLEDLSERLNSFQDNVNHSQNSLANVEEKLASHDIMGSKDLRNLDKLQVRDSIDQLVFFLKNAMSGDASLY